MTELNQNHLYAVVSHPKEDAILMHEDGLPGIPLSGLGGNTYEALINAHIRRQHSLISQVKYGLTPRDKSLGYHLSIVRNTYIPDGLDWVSHTEAEARIMDELMLHFVRDALAAQHS